VDPVVDPLLHRKFGSAGNRTLDLWVSSQEVCPLDHGGGQRAYHATPIYPQKLAVKLAGQRRLLSRYSLLAD
jgi:hypothetical protein